MEKNKIVVGINIFWLLRGTIDRWRSACIYRITWSAWGTYVHTLYMWYSQYVDMCYENMTC